MKKTKKPQATDFVSEKMFTYLFLSVLLLLVMVHLMSTYWGTPFLWGVHHLYFFPRWVGWILTIVIISFFIPSVNSFMLKFFESIFSALEKIFTKIRKYPLFAIVSLLSIPVFWSLRTKLFLLGDGYNILKKLSNGMITPTEWLDGIIHQEFYRFLSMISPGIDPSFSYSIPSVVCGGIFIFLILTLSDLLGKTTFQKVLIFSILFTLGSIELFFGYVESYTILLVSLTLFILFSILYVQARASIIFSFLALVLSVGLHVSAIVFVPSFFYVIFWKWQSEKRKLLDIFTLLSLLGCFGMISFIVWKVFFLKGEGGGFSRFLPLLPSAKTDFTLFCGAHIGEFANQLLLLSPVGTISFLFFLFYTLKFRSFKDPILNFLLISSLLSLLLVFVYNSRWGSVDWDLMSFPGIFLTLLGILLFVKWGSEWPKFKNHGLILIAVSFFHTVPWIIVNADRQMSVDRYILTAENDRHILCAPGGGMWRVARVLEEAGFTEKAEKILKRGIKRNPEELGCFSYLGKILHYQERYDEAMFYLKRGLRLKPQSKEIRYSLGQIYLKKEDLQKAIFHLEKVKGEYEQNSVFVIKLANAYLKVGRPEDAKDILQGFLAKNQESATMRGLLGTSFFMLKDFSNAKKEWEMALKLNPDELLAKTGLEELRKTREK
jgi:cytochrome c-type biogenesis protein CcmH/NrfG